VLIGTAPPVMVKSDKNPGGLPIEVFDGFRALCVDLPTFASIKTSTPSGASRSPVI
jgi:hypothetical protein